MTCYVAGKKRIGKVLSATMLDVIARFQRCGVSFAGYYECFLGMGGVMQHMVQPLRELFPGQDFSLVGTDKNERVMTFWEALQQGWTPPRAIDYREYVHLKESKDEISPMHTFIGYCTGFQSQYFLGRAPPDRVEQRVRNNHDNVIKMRDIMSEVSFGCDDFFDLDAPRRFICYLDPPYKLNTVTTSDLKFDHGQFWNRALQWSRDNLVFVSETEAPPGWVSLWSKTWNNRANSRTYQRTEHLFVHQDALDRLGDLENA